MVFTSLEQRMTHSYFDLFPPFIPEEQTEVTVKEQEVQYNFMKSFYQLAYHEPLLFVTALHDQMG